MKTVIEMAGQAFETPGTEPAFRNGFWTVTQEELERFAELVRADERKKWEEQTAVEIHEAILEEREACAKVCDDWPNGRDDVYSIGVAIRARSDK